MLLLRIGFGAVLVNILYAILTYAPIILKILMAL